VIIDSQVMFPETDITGPARRARSLMPSAPIGSFPATAAGNVASVKAVARSRG